MDSKGALWGYGRYCSLEFSAGTGSKKDWKCLGLRKYDGGKAAIRNTFNCYEICGADSKGKQFAKGRFKLCYRFRQGCWGCIGKK